MKLIFLYGPPAVGKLTVARELERLTGFKLFHNHLTADLVKSVFDYGTPPYFHLIYKVRRDLIEIASQENISIITTFVYTPEDVEFVADIVSSVEKHGGNVVFVQLEADRTTLNERVAHDARKEFRKLHTIESLDRYFTRWRLGTSVEYDRVLTIDNSHLQPLDVAQRIVQHLSPECD